MSARLPLAVLISGRGSNMVAIASACATGAIRAEIRCVLSDRPDAAGLAIAREMGLTTQAIEPSQFADRERYEAELAQAIDASGARLVVLAGFMRILSAAFVRRYAGRMLNIHPSLLPRYKGLHTHRRVLEAGEREHGASVHFVTAELDAGPVIAQARVPVLPGDTEESLAARVQTEEHRIYPQAIGLIADGRLELADGRARLDGRTLATPLAIALAWVGAITLSLLPAHVAGAEITPFEASYAWSWHGATVAISTLKLERRSGDVWVYSSSSEPRGLGHLYPMRPKEQSVLRISEQGVEPLSFHSDTGMASHDANVTFDWQALHASGTYEGTVVDLVLQPGVQDDLSVQIAMIVATLRGQTPDKLLMIDKNSIRDYHYKREGEEKLTTALGPIATIVYSTHHDPSPRTTRYWCAPSQGDLPMKVEQKKDDGVEWTLEIQSLKRE